jgi:hypothetical protein
VTAKRFLSPPPEATLGLVIRLLFEQKPRAIGPACAWPAKKGMRYAVGQAGMRKRARPPTNRKLTGAFRALLVATSFSALSAGIAHAEELRDLNARILDNTQDVELNLLYARQAEKEGQLRLALAAYERVLINNPENEEAQRGYTRVRRIIEPAYRSFRAELGVEWDSNPFNTADWDKESYSTYWRVSGVDERRIGSQRWRTHLNLDGKIEQEIEELNYGRIAIQTGPILDMAPNLAANPAAGVAVASLDDSYYYTEANLSVTFEGQRDGVSFWTRGRVGYRSYAEDAAADEGPQAEIAAGVSIPRIATQRDSLTLSPWARWSAVEGSTFDAFNSEATPGEYAEYGIDASYQIQFNGYVRVAAGVLAYDRHYTNSEVAAGKQRRDVYVSPQATLTFQNIMPCQCAVNVTWRWRINDSNDPVADYEARQISAGFAVRF